MKYKSRKMGAWLLCIVMMLMMVNLPAFTVEVKADEEEPFIVTVDGLQYQLEPGYKDMEAVVVGLEKEYYKAQDTIAIEIPECIEIDGKKISVTKIGDEAFFGKSKIVSITMPDTITEAGERSFANCKGLETIKLSNILSPLQSDSFAFCIKLKSVNIPSYWTYIPEGLFQYIGTLEEITIPANIKTIKKNAFKDTGLTKVYYGGTEEEWIALMGAANTTEGNGVLVSPTISVEMNVHQFTAPEDIDDLYHKSYCNLCDETIRRHHIDKDNDGKCDDCSHAMPDKNDCYFIEFARSLQPVDGLTPDYEIKDTNVNGRIVVAWMKMDGKAFCEMTGNDEFFTYIERNAGVRFEEFLELNEMEQLERFEEATTYALQIVLVDEKEPDYLYINGELFAADSPDEGVALGDFVEFVCGSHEHRYGAPLFTWNGYSEAKVTFTCEGDDTHKEVKKATITSKVTKEATTTAEGIKTYTAQVVFEGKEYTDTKTEVIPLVKEDSKPDDSKSYNQKQDDLKSEDSKTEAPKKGDTVTDNQTKAVYQVTNADATKGEVSYTSSTDADATVVEVPATVTINNVTYKVTKIADNAFKDNKKITKVTLNDDVITIGKNAFSGCTKLKTVTIGKNVTTIDNKAFYKCTSLTKIIIPASVTKIGKSAFEGCKKLKKVTIKTTKLTSKKVGSKAFKGINAKAKVKVPKAKLSAYKKILKKKGISGKKQKITK